MVDDSRFLVLHVKFENPEVELIDAFTQRRNTFVMKETHVLRQCHVSMYILCLKAAKRSRSMFAAFLLKMLTAGVRTCSSKRRTVEKDIRASQISEDTSKIRPL